MVSHKIATIKTCHIGSMFVCSRCPVYLLNQICVETVKRVTLAEPYSHIPSPDLDETKVLNDSETCELAHVLIFG